MNTFNEWIFKYSMDTFNCHVYPKRSPDVFFLSRIFDPAFKRVRCLFRPQYLFPIVHLSRVEWQVLVPVFTSLIVCLDANMYIKVHRLHSLTKHTSAILREGNEHDNDWMSNFWKEDAHIKRDIENKLFSLMYGTILTFNESNFGTWCLNRPRHLFRSFCCTTQCIFEATFNTDIYDT